MCKYAKTKKCQSEYAYICIDVNKDKYACKNKFKISNMKKSQLPPPPCSESKIASAVLKINNFINALV